MQPVRSALCISSQRSASPSVRAIPFWVGRSEFRERQTPKNHPSMPSRSSIACASEVIRLRKSIASRIDSPVSVSPPGSPRSGP
jgi:hypothetical protein